jgi:hypothetical protein
MAIRQLASRGNPPCRRHRSNSARKRIRIPTKQETRLHLRLTLFRDGETALSPARQPPVEPEQLRQWTVETFGGGIRTEWLQRTHVAQLAGTARYLKPHDGIEEVMAANFCRCTGRRLRSDRKSQRDARPSISGVRTELPLPCEPVAPARDKHFKRLLVAPIRLTGKSVAISRYGC